jgi:hypothetical protein
MMPAQNTSEVSVCTYLIALLSSYFFFFHRTCYQINVHEHSTGPSQWNAAKRSLSGKLHWSFCRGVMATCSEDGVVMLVILYKWLQVLFPAWCRCVVRENELCNKKSVASKKTVGVFRILSEGKNLSYSQ